MRRLVRFSICIFGLAAVACSQQSAAPQSTPSQRPVGSVHGTAQVVSVDESLGLAVLNYNGKQVQAYWQTEVLHPRGGAMTSEPGKPVVGQYEEAVVTQPKFAAKAGDTIDFIGFWTGSGILLRGISPVK